MASAQTRTATKANNLHPSGSLMGRMNLVLPRLFQSCSSEQTEDVTTSMSRAGETENCWERRHLVRIEREARNGKPQIRQIHQRASHAQARMPALPAKQDVRAGPWR